MEAVNASIRLSHCEEGLAVRALGAHEEVELSIQIDGAAVQHSIDTQALHEVGVGANVQVIPPMDGCELAGEHRVLIALIDAVVDIRNDILAGDELVYFGLFDVIIGMQHLFFLQAVFV